MTMFEIYHQKFCFQRVVYEHPEHLKPMEYKLFVDFRAGHSVERVAKKNSMNVEKAQNYRDILALKGWL